MAATSTSGSAQRADLCERPGRVLATRVPVPPRKASDETRNFRNGGSRQPRRYTAELLDSTSSRAGRPARSRPWPRWGGATRPAGGVVAQVRTRAAGRSRRRGLGRRRRRGRTTAVGHAQRLLQLAHLDHVPRSYQGDERCVGAARPCDHRRCRSDHAADVVDVDSPCRDVGGHRGLHRALGEGRQRPGPAGPGSGRRGWGGGQTGALEPGGQRSVPSLVRQNTMVGAVLADQVGRQRHPFLAFGRDEMVTGPVHLGGGGDLAALGWRW